MPLPLGEVAEHSEDGEGKQIDLITQKKVLFPPCRVRVCGPAFAEPRKPCGCGKSGIPLFPSQSPAATALPEGEPSVYNEKWSVSLLIRSINCFTPPSKAEQNYFCDTEHSFDMIAIFMSFSGCICSDPACKNFPLDLQTSHKGSRSTGAKNERHAQKSPSMCVSAQNAPIIIY